MTETSVVPVRKYGLFFAYGTLKSGHSRHHVLRDDRHCRHIGFAYTQGSFALYYPDLKDETFPIMLQPQRKESAYQVKGELYRIPLDKYKNLDEIEGPTYSRIEIPLIWYLTEDWNNQNRPWFYAKATAYLGSRDDWEWAFKEKYMKPVPSWTRIVEPKFTYFDFTAKTGKEKAAK